MKNCTVNEIIAVAMTVEKGKKKKALSMSSALTDTECAAAKLILCSESFQIWCVYLQPPGNPVKTRKE